MDPLHARDSETASVWMRQEGRGCLSRPAQIGPPPRVRDVARVRALRDLLGRHLCGRERRPPARLEQPQRAPARRSVRRVAVLRSA